MDRPLDVATLRWIGTVIVGVGVAATALSLLVRWTMLLPLRLEERVQPWLLPLKRAVFYRTPWRRAFYRMLKWVYGALTRTTEIFRITDAMCHVLAASPAPGAVPSPSARAARVAGAPGAESDEEQRPLLSDDAQADAYADVVATSSAETDRSFPASQLPPHLLHRLDLSLLYSKQLDAERRIVEGAGRTAEEQKDVWMRILQRKRFPQRGAPTTPHARMLRDALDVLHTCYVLQADLNARAATPYDRMNRAHERRLLELWGLMMPGRPLTGRVSAMWRAIGFQGHDPATDFRGMGLLGLDQLHYLAQTYPVHAHAVLRISQHETAWFPFAITGINVTAFCLTLMRQRELQSWFLTLGLHPSTFHEFYCVTFWQFAQFWSHGLERLTPMDFGRVFLQFQQRVIHALRTERRPRRLVPIHVPGATQASGRAPPVHGLASATAAASLAPPVPSLVLHAAPEADAEAEADAETGRARPESPLAAAATAILAQPALAEDTLPASAWDARRAPGAVVRPVVLVSGRGPGRPLAPPLRSSDGEHEGESDEADSDGAGAGATGTSRARPASQRPLTTARRRMHRASSSPVRQGPAAVAHADGAADAGAGAEAAAAEPPET